MEQLEEELTCPICCGLFEDPRVLLCSHSFCRKCLERLLEGSRGPAFRAPFKCPTCRKETPHNGAGSLQSNYSLRGIVEKYSRLKVTPPQTSACARHRGQPLNIFCSTDLKLICGFCATTEAHKGHRFSSLEEAYAQEKAAFEELFDRVARWQSAGTASRLETLRSSKKRALQAVTEDASTVAEYFEQLIGSLECKKSEILSDFETLKLAALQSYDPEIARLSAVMEAHARARELAESFRSVTEPLSFLQHMQEFRETQGLFGETLPPCPRHVDAARFARNFDVKKWDSLRLCEVDKICVPHGSGSCRAWVDHLWIIVFFSLLFTSLLLLQPPRTLAASAHSQVEQSVAAVSSLLAHAPAYLQDATDTWSLLTCAARKYIVLFIESVIDSIDILFNG
ncbi:tripartite motif-containing 13 [Brachionichthys hirsutus]|uniref:tripartite motif-containing 13 n=1 Tax=Brachionichthys hirsutus TaxID=412623 RepID=UPI0036053194